MLKLSTTLINYISNCDFKDMFKIVNELLNKNNRSLSDCNSCEDLADQFSVFIVVRSTRSEKWIVLFLV